MDISSKSPILILRQNQQNENKNTLPIERLEPAIDQLTKLFAADDAVGDSLRLLLRLAHGEGSSSKDLSLLLLLSTAETRAKNNTSRPK